MLTTLISSLTVGVLSLVLLAPGTIYRTQSIGLHRMQGSGISFRQGATGLGIGRRSRYLHLVISRISPYRAWRLQFVWSIGVTVRLEEVKVFLFQ